MLPSASESQAERQQNAEKTSNYLKLNYSKLQQIGGPTGLVPNSMPRDGLDSWDALPRSPVPMMPPS
jgi:hypothetical protein